MELNISYALLYFLEEVELKNIPFKAGKEFSTKTVLVGFQTLANKYYT